MKMLCECIQDLRTIQSKYPDKSRGYESLRFAITILERAIELKEEVNPHWVAGATGASYTINVPEGAATVTLGDSNAG